MEASSLSDINILTSSTSESPREEEEESSILPNSTSETSIFSSPPSSPDCSLFSHIDLTPNSNQQLPSREGSNQTIQPGLEARGGAEISIKSIAFGTFTREGIYSVEYDASLTKGSLSYLKKEACLVILGQKFLYSTFKILFSLDSFHSLVLDNRYIYLNLAYGPYYFVSSSSLNSSRSSPASFYRTNLPFDEDHKRVSPFASCRIRIEFSTPTDRNQFLSTFKTYPLPLVRKQSINSRNDLQLYSQENLESFEKGLSEYSSIGHAFQISAILYDGLLSPLELESLRGRIFEIVYRRGNQLTENILVELRRLLVEERRRRDNKFGEDKSEEEINVEEVEELLFEAESNVKETEELRRNKSLFGCYHLYATSYYLLGPIIETGNSIMRKYRGNEENFLRVSFVEEDQTKLQMNKMGVNRSFLEQSVTRILQTGLNLNGRTYEFLSYSKSSQKAHSVWFLSPFPSLSLPFEIVNASSIIEAMGDFSRIRYQPSLLGSRISQAFTASKEAGWIGKEDVFEILDLTSVRMDGSESIHTDGAGIMSLKMRNKICQALDISTFPLPTVFQVRIAGAKGLLLLDIQLEGFKIGLTPSMKKFEGALDHEGIGYKINISDTFTRPSKLFLNRPLVSALDDLEIPTKRFLDLQEEMLNRLEKNSNNLAGIKSLLDRYSIGKNLGNLLESISPIISDSENFVKDESIQLYLAIALQKVRDDIKHFARIEVPTSLQLVGVPDWDQYLKPDEVYVCTDIKGERVVREGKMAITRSPTVDPGDIRIVTGVRIPPGKAPRTQALFNCVVLPTVGKRSLSSMMSGGDLDGDLYQLIPLSNLIPENTIPESDVLEHEGETPRRLNRPATAADIANNVVNFMERDVIGLLGMEHLKTADRYTGNHPICRRLAGLYSKAVDYSKSGVEIRSSEIPRRSYEKWPDFLTKQNSIYSDRPTESYYSLRALGCLFRAVPDAKDKEFSFETRVDYTNSLLSIAYQKLRVYVDETKLNKMISNLISSATPICQTFLVTFLRCATIYNFPRRLGRNLSEAETFMGTILAVPSREVDKQGRYAASVELQEQVGILLGDINKLVQNKRSLGEQCLMWSTCWEVGLKMSASPGSEFGVSSLKWTCIREFFDTLASIERKGWDWKDLVNSLEDLEEGQQDRKDAEEFDQSTMTSPVDLESLISVPLSSSTLKLVQPELSPSIPRIPNPNSSPATSPTSSQPKVVGGWGVASSNLAPFSDISASSGSLPRGLAIKGRRRNRGRLVPAIPDSAPPALSPPIRSLNGWTDVTSSRWRIPSTLSPQPSSQFSSQLQPPFQKSQPLTPSPQLATATEWGRISLRERSSPPLQKFHPTPSPLENPPIRVNGFRPTIPRTKPQLDSHIPIRAGVAPYQIQELNNVEEPELVLPKGRPKHLKDRDTERSQRRIKRELERIRESGGER